MKNTLVFGNATTDNNHIHFRKTSFLTESNRMQIEKCVHAFIELPLSFAFHDLVKMTCYPKKDIPEEFWENIHLTPELIPEEAWPSFVNELRYQYKIRNPVFMTEFMVPTECSAAYDTLVSDTSEVAAYLFYKKASTFLYDHINAPIGVNHINDTFNRLNWHARDPEVNRVQQIKGLRRLSLRSYEADYFYNHLGKCINLLQSMLDYMQKDEQSSILETAAEAVANDNDLPFVMGDPDGKVVTESKEKSFLELSLENLLTYEKDFLGFLLSNDADCQNRLHAAGFNMEHVLSKSIAICWVIHSHNEMEKAIEALSK